MIDFRFGIAESESPKYSESKSFKAQVKQESLATPKEDSDNTEILTTKTNLWPWQTW